MATKVTWNTVRGAWGRYKDLRYTYRDLSDAYGRYSQAKANAWKSCERLCEEYHGRDLRIIGRNGFTFSAGFIFADEDGKVNFMWITKDYDRYAEVAE